MAIVACAEYDLTTPGTLEASKLEYHANVDGTQDLPPQGQLVQLRASLANIAGSPGSLSVQLFADLALEEPLSELVSLPVYVSPTDATQGAAFAALALYYTGSVYARCGLDQGGAGVTLCAWAI